MVHLTFEMCIALSYSKQPNKHLHSSQNHKCNAQIENRNNKTRSNVFRQWMRSLNQISASVDGKHCTVKLIEKKRSQSVRFTFYNQRPVAGAFDETFQCSHSFLRLSCGGSAKRPTYLLTLTNHFQSYSQDVIMR